MATAKKAAAKPVTEYDVADTVDDDGQVKPDAPQAGTVTASNVFGIDDGRQYASGSGFEAGQMAPSDKYLDLETGKTSGSQPERGKLLAAKGQPVTPDMARRIADAEA